MQFCEFIFEDEISQNRCDYRANEISDRSGSHIHVIHHIDKRKPIRRQQNTANNIQTNRFLFAFWVKRFENLKIILQLLSFEKQGNDSHYQRTAEDSVKQNVQRSVRMKRFQNQTECSPYGESDNGGEIEFKMVQVVLSFRINCKSSYLFVEFSQKSD